MSDLDSIAVELGYQLTEEELQMIYEASRNAQNQQLRKEAKQRERLDKILSFLHARLSYRVRTIDRADPTMTETATLQWGDFDLTALSIWYSITTTLRYRGKTIAAHTFTIDYNKKAGWLHNAAANFINLAGWLNTRDMSNYDA